MSKKIPERFSKEKKEGSSFYTKGYFFDNEDDFFELATDWNDYDLDKDQFRKNVIQIMEDILDSDATLKFTNGKAWELLELLINT